jgi:hypothetical protein
MAISRSDDQITVRREQDEQIAAEPKLDSPDLPPGATPLPVEEHLARIRKKPVAVAGIVENGLVRPLDPTVRLPENAWVIIVASEPS